MNITKIAWNYVESHPSINDCVKNKLINYSSLARRIVKENNLKPTDFDAVLIACRRYYWNVRKQATAEDAITSLVSKSKVEVKTKVSVAVLDKEVYSEDLIGIEKKAKKQNELFYAIEGSEAITIVIASALIGELKQIFKGSIRRSWNDLVLVILRSPEGEQDKTPGLLAFLAGRISQNNINILEVMSCWSETLFVVAEQDVARVLESLKMG